MKIVALTVVAIALGGCAAITNTENNAINKIASIEIADLDAAVVDANANNDVIAATCYPALKTFVAGLQTWQARPAPGAVSRFQKQRDIDKFILYGPPSYLEVACMALVADVRRDANGLVTKFFTLLAQATALVSRIP